MKRTTMFLGALLLIVPLAGCEVEKTGEDTYQVEAPTDEAERTADSAAERTREAGRELAEEAREAGQAIEQGARDAAHKTGTALEKAGKEMQKHSKPGDQK
ncbi:MAG TPA: hypothetical protein VMS56_05570 [Thermoanaerobaculia bacterium]|nr:hypothetical protein [Thermoanaerobaculia bacterium]